MLKSINTTKEMNGEETIKFNFENLNDLIDIIIDNYKGLDINRDDVENISQLAGYIFLDSSHSYYMKNCYDEHNLINGTYGKKDVPTLRQTGDIFTNIFYCPNCKKMHQNLEYKGEVTFYIDDSEDEYYLRKASISGIDSYTCKECDIEYSKYNIKFLDGTPEYMYGDVFIDENKVTISTKYMNNGYNRHGYIYYEDGYVRLTLNTKTGYSYTTNKGASYKDLCDSWTRYGKVPPTMFNSTYTTNDNSDSALYYLMEAKIVEEFKSMSQIELINLFSSKNIQKKMDMKDEIRKQLVNKIAINLYNQVQSHFNYKIPEIIKEIYPNANYRIVKMLKLFNRYVNLDPTQQSMLELCDKYYGFKANKIRREEVNPLYALFKAEKIKVGKKTRALLQQQRYNQELLRFLPIILQLKNPSNINKLVNLIAQNEKITFSYEFYVSGVVEAINLWKTYRSENYIANQIEQELKDIIQRYNKGNYFKNSYSKLFNIKDSVYMISNITKNIKDFNVNDVIDFHNEKQFHDDLTKFMNSDVYHTLVEKSRASIVFDLEPEVAKMEDVENNIFVAKNSADLMRIGKAMGICVGGYTDQVLNNYCKIVYIMDENNETYKACLEIRPKLNKYSLVQAKLKYNERACQDIEMFNKIVAWASKHKIKIDTYDMELNEEQAPALAIM